MIIVASFRMLLWMMFVTGIVYPLAVTFISYAVMEEKASGSMVSDLGSALIAQSFTSDRFFWPRPSAIGYNPLPSGASNLSVTSSLLKKQVDERKAKFASANVPAELLFASGSGLDPHISPQCAYFQIDRVANARHMEREIIRKLVDVHIERPFIGKPCVNVLLLNLALEEL